MPDFKPLHIPKRDRKKGEYVYCLRCRTNVTDKCKRSGMRISTCKFPESHRFQSKANDKIRKRMVPIVTHPKELRDYKEFSRLHQMAVNRYEQEYLIKRNPTRPLRPALLSHAMDLYMDWFEDIDVPSHKVKGYDEKTIRGELNDLKVFQQALQDNGIDFKALLVKDVDDDLIGVYYGFLESKYANKTINNKLASLKRLFNFLIAQGYEIPNPIDEVKFKPTKASKVFIRSEDFEGLLSIINVENGIKFEKDNGKIKRKSFYREWLAFYYRLAFLTGARQPAVSQLRLSNVQKDFIIKPDTKVSKKKGQEQVRLMVLTEELECLIDELKDSYSLGSNDFLIAPYEKNRLQIQHHASKAFTHYWRQLDAGYRATCDDLRDTHITLMLQRFGTLYQGLYGAHDSFETSRQNYASEQIMIKELRGKKMLG